MKKFITYCATLLLLCGLCACGEAKQEETEGFSIKLVDELAEQGAFSEKLEMLDADTVFMLYQFADYGLEREMLMDCMVLRSAGATCEEAAVLVWTTSEAMGSAHQALGDYMEDQIISNEDYRPNEIPKLQEARLGMKGNTTLLVVANDYGVVSQVLNK